MESSHINILLEGKPYKVRPYLLKSWGIKKSKLNKSLATITTTKDMVYEIKLKDYQELLLSIIQGDRSNEIANLELIRLSHKMPITNLLIEKKTVGLTYIVEADFVKGAFRNQKALLCKLDSKVDTGYFSLS